VARVDTGMVARRRKQRWCRTVDTQATRQEDTMMQVTAAGDTQESLSNDQSIHELDYSLLSDYRAAYVVLP
jgi:hypothetical protein